MAIASAAGVPGLRGSEDVLGILLSAIDSRQAVQFPHRPSRAEPYTTRTVEPWGVVTEKGRWYLVGHDRDRDATRTFRLSRIGAEVTPIGPTGAVTVPDGVDLRKIVAQTVAETPTGGLATVWVADGRATALRRAGRSVGARQLAGRDGEVIELDIRSADGLARDVAGYGADAIVLEPQSLREDVLAPVARAQAERGRSGAHDFRVGPPGAAAQHGAVFPGQPADHPRRGRRRAAGSPASSSRTTSTSCGCAAFPATAPAT